MSNSTAAAAAASYKARKEEFVSNLSGGSVAEINYVTAVAPAAVLLWSVLQARQSFFKPYSVLGYVVDYLLSVVAILLSFTLYAGSPLLLIGLLLAPALLIYALPPNSRSRRKKPRVPPPQLATAKTPGSNGDAKSARPDASGKALNTLSVKPFLTTYRGFMLVTTCVAILAVDFRLFPRRFAKVETWGTSLMDMGVGSFVFSAGVVAARPLLRERAEKGAAPSLPKRLLQAMRHSVPLLALGLVRLLSVKGVDYAEHVSEYGVHWNFFFTLGLLPPFVAAFQSALKVVPSYAVLALVLGVSYQVVLESTPLKAFVLTAPRTDWLSSNREGIFSFFGYLAIFLAGQDTGMFVLPRKLNPHSGSSPGTQRNTLLMTIMIWWGVWTALYFFTTSYSYGFGLSVSRRMANLPYMLWVVSFNLAQIFAFCVIDTIFFPAFYNAADARSEKEAYETATSRVLRAFNRNGLAIFLVANLLTGLVNLTVPTLDVEPIVAVTVLIAYTATLTVVALGLDMYDISIKL